MQRREHQDDKPPVVTPPLTSENERRQRRERVKQPTVPNSPPAQGESSGVLDRIWGEREATPPAFVSPPEEEESAETSQQRLSLLDRLRSGETTSSLTRPSTDDLKRQLGRSPLVEIRYPPASRPSPTSYQLPGPKVLVVAATGHRILLPENGDLVLGRLDPMAQIKPDIDFTFADRSRHGVSRRHASISGWHGRYEISDLGSGNGTWVNGERIELQQSTILHVGDEVRLGYASLFFDRAPPALQDPPDDASYFFYVTFTGRYFPLPDRTVITIGRADPVLGYTPDVDLSDEGDAASVVSRHHAKLIREGNGFMIEDLGSAFKTQVDGQPVYVGTHTPIRPGQHLWLGGCVLAFDLV
jgi:pSer/pThr/pTyr-binding forkhead associated (FHA) protein